MLRSVNSQLKRTLHEETNVSLDIRVSQLVLLQLNQDFLFTWKGTLFIHIKNVKSDCHPWLQSLAAALASESKPRIGILDLEVAGKNLPPLVGLLSVALADQRAVQRVTLRYKGACRPVAAAAAPLAALQAAVRTEVIATIVQDSSADVVDGLSALHNSGVAVRTLELRQEPTTTAATTTTPSELPPTASIECRTPTMPIRCHTCQRRLGHA